MFQFSGFASFRILYLQYSGLPHSDICGSICMCQSPQLFAACHALLRLREPRHPPYALCNFLRQENPYISLFYPRYSVIQFISLFTFLLFPIMPKNFKAVESLRSKVYCNPPSLSFHACADKKGIEPLHSQTPALS